LAEQREQKQRAVVMLSPEHAVSSVLQDAENRQYTHTHTHTRLMALCLVLPGYQKGKTNLDFTEARDSEWQWHQLGHMQVCTSHQTDNHASNASSLQAGCPSCHPTNHQRTEG